MSDQADADTDQESPEEESIWSRGGDNADEGDSGADPIGSLSGDSDVAERAKEFADDADEDQSDSLEAEEPADSDAESEGPIDEEDDSQDSGDDAEDDEDADPKDDEDRYEHWQSRYQKAESNLGFKPDEIDETEAELYDALHNNPEYRRKFVEFVHGDEQSGEGQGDGQPDVGSSDTEELVEPERPEKPEDYSKYDAVNDPDSDSWKYRESLEEYRDDMIEYQRKLRERDKQQREQERQQAKQQVRAQQLRQEARKELKSEHDFDDDQVDGFFEFLNTEEFESEDLVTMYKAVEGIDDSEDDGDSDIQEKKRRAEKRKKKQKQHAPSPASSGGAGNQGGGTSGDGPDDHPWG